MKYFTLKKVALAHKAAWQVLRFAAGKGYYLFGANPAGQGGEAKNESPFTRLVQKVLPPMLTMYDSVDVKQIPADAQAVAGYVGGHWPTFGTLAAEWPAATHKVSIAVFASEDADCLDVENGDATNSEAAAWVKRQLARGAKKPIVYTSLSNAETLRAALRQAGIRTGWTLRGGPQVRIWTAHYTEHAHLCSKACGYGFAGTADATQWDDKALGRTLDVSLCSRRFFS